MWVRLDLEYKNNDDDCKSSQDHKNGVAIEVSGVFNVVIIELRNIHSICYGRCDCS